MSATNSPEEKNMERRIKTTKVVYPQLYSYVLPDLTANEGSQKIGYTERKDVDERIREQTQTAAMKLRYDKLWSAPSFFTNSNTDFTDKIFHQFLVRNGVEKRDDLGTEWFYFNGTPEKSKQLFDSFRNEGYAALQNNNGKKPYTLREEQEAAVSQAIEYFNNYTNGEFLWNAKPRFGKTLATYDLAKRLGAQKVLIVTNRPAIANSWFDDFENYIEDFYFISETSSLAERGTLTRAQYVDSDVEKPQITFLSLQDLKGSRFFGGKHDKLKWIADLEWDLLVIDEAHEGVDTGRTDAAFDVVKRSHTLHLSGTPFKALANNKFPKEAIFNWTYLDEQKIKKLEISENETGDHTDLPDLKLFTYRISQMIAEQVNEGIELENESRDYAFDLNEFFATENQKFVREQDVRQFLKNLSANKKYPFSTPELRDELRHTFWYVGNRVDSVKALEKLLADDDVFKDYKVVVAAGDGKSFDEEETDFGANEKSFDKVKKAIKNHPKTITLSCGQLTTGVTIKEWSAVLMLTDIKSTPVYMQAAFRAQNPYKYYEDGMLKVKESAYLFDFAPIRVLEMYDEFANGLNPDATNGLITEEDRKGNIRELLNYFPVISEDTEGQMVELDAEKVLTFPNALAATEIVQARFMTNLLFNDNIKGVFHFPKEVEDILDKMPVEKNKRVEVSKQSLDLEDARKVEQDKQAKISENTGVILGEKIYRANIDRVVDNVLDQATPEETIDMLPEKVEALVEAPIAKLKEQYKLTATETDELRKETAEKIKIVVSEFENSDDKDPDTLKQSLANVIEHDLVQAKVEQQETKAVETVQKSKEEEVREHLRAFTRTIPMFVMANSSRDTITIDNFDEQISDEDFIDLTNITKEEFHKLRDGFDYSDDNGERQHFDGVFHKYKFNASIAEFVSEKQKRANYFETDDDIFELIPNQKNNQIFTPRKVVKMMIDGLEKEQPELFKRTDSTFIDLYMKSGMYVTEIVKKLFAGTRHNYSTDKECLKHILENQVYGLAPTGVLHGITKSYILGFDVDHNISSRNFVQHDLLPEAKAGTAAQKIADLFNNGDINMKFDAVVGNPPYQVALSQNKMSRSIYPDFVRAAKKISETFSFVMPARWMSGENGPYRETQGFVDEMLDGSHLKSFTLFPDSSELFKGVDIKGGVCYFVWDKNYSKDLVDYTLSERGKDVTAIVPFKISDNIIVRFPQLTNIVQKISRNAPSDSMKTLVSSWNPFGFISDLFVKNNEGVRRISEKKMDTDDYKVIGLLKGRRVYRYIPNDELKKNRIGAKSWKVFVPRANGSGVFGEVFSTPMLGVPMLVCTDTFLQVGEFDNEYEANSVLTYVKTKFFRAMVGVKKTAVFNYKDAFTFVPQQNWTNKSDIDWSKSIAEIDQQLYKKYGLSNDEIDFIESRVKPME
ncbi:hypothetical protein LBMAG34_2040 [Candidatus Saccharibacteria bacterium]|nr:hypothetical protein LBMAG34_2040 [Candidatus Saccharibacteria bacterium]